jgi:hypothetical protein
MLIVSAYRLSAPRPCSRCSAAQVSGRDGDRWIAVARLDASRPRVQSMPPCAKLLALRRGGRRHARPELAPQLGSSNATDRAHSATAIDPAGHRIAYTGSVQMLQSTRIREYSDCTSHCASDERVKSRPARRTHAGAVLKWQAAVLFALHTGHNPKRTFVPHGAMPERSPYVIRG